MVIYLASGLGAVMIITTSMMLMIMALTCVRHKQAKESLLEAQVMHTCQGKTHQEHLTNKNYVYRDI